MIALVAELWDYTLASLLVALRYGLIAFCISYGAGHGCREWPLIKKTDHGVEVCNAGNR